MKKVLSLLVAGLIAVFLVGCSFDEVNTGSNSLNTKEDVLGFSALTSIKALSFLDEEQLVVAAESLSYSYLEANVEGEETEDQPVEGEETEDQPVEGEETENQPAEENKELVEIETYLALIKSLKEDNGFGVQTTESDNEDYETLMVITLKDIDGNSLEYKFYYNETIIDDEESSLEGIMIVSGVTYYLEGEKEIEIDEDETEESLELKASIDEDNYVLLSYEIETETDELEKEFEYSIYQNGELVRAMQIEFEEEEGETEIELSITENSTTRSYEFEIEDDEIEVKHTVKENGETILNQTILITVTFDEETQKDIITYVIKGEDDDEDEEISHEYESDDDDDEDDEDDEENDEDDEVEYEDSDEEETK